jgi:hypothetical protein
VSVLDASSPPESIPEKPSSSPAISARSPLLATLRRAVETVLVSLLSLPGNTWCVVSAILVRQSAPDDVHNFALCRSLSSIIGAATGALIVGFFGSVARDRRVRALDRVSRQRLSAFFREPRRDAAFARGSPNHQESHWRGTVNPLGLGFWL